MKYVSENLRGNVIGSCNSWSHGPMEFEDFFKLLSDRATRKWPTEKVELFLQHGHLCP